MSSQFYFARIKFDQKPLSMGPNEEPTFDQDTVDRIRELVESNEFILPDGGGEWRFGQSRRIEGENIILGKFGKEFTDKPTQYSDEVEDFVDREGVDADVSYFIVFLQIGVIAFGRKLRIGPQQFISAFSQSYNRYHAVGPRMELEVLENSLSFEEVFDTADVVNNIIFELIPTNPEANDEMQDMDDRFKEAKADTFDIEMDSDSGLNITARVVRAGKEFVKNDYGEAIVSYFVDGRSEQYSTKSDSATMRSEEDPEDLNELQSILSDIQDQATGILSRNQDNDDD